MRCTRTRSRCCLRAWLLSRWTRRHGPVCCQSYCHQVRGTVEVPRTTQSQKYAGYAGSGDLQARRRPPSTVAKVWVRKRSGDWQALWYLSKQFWFLTPPALRLSIKGCAELLYQSSQVQRGTEHCITFAALLFVGVRLRWDSMLHG